MRGGWRGQGKVPGGGWLGAADWQHPTKNPPHNSGGAADQLSTMWGWGGGGGGGVMSKQDGC